MIGFDRQMIYHRKCAYLGAICCLLHIFDHRKALTTWKAQTGWICYGAAVLLLITANNYFRRNHYNAFFIRSHWLFIVVFLVFGWMHNAIAIQIGTGFIVIDSIIRAIDLRFRSTKIVGMKLFDYGRVIKLEFEKKHFRYKPGQYVFIRVQAVGRLEFHPFSISSYPGSGRTFSVHIKGSVASANGWTSRLMKFMKEHEHKPEHYKDISVQIEGPFGELTLRKELYRYEHVVFIGGGIGVTPLDSLYNQLVTDLLDNKMKRRNAKTSKIDFIFTTRSRALITEFASRNKAWEFYADQMRNISTTQTDALTDAQTDGVSSDPPFHLYRKPIMELDENVDPSKVRMKSLPFILKAAIQNREGSKLKSERVQSLGEEAVEHKSESVGDQALSQISSVPVQLSNSEHLKESMSLTLRQVPVANLEMESDDLPSRTLSNSLHLKSFDRTIGSDKPSRISFISSKASMNIIPEFTEDRNPNLKEVHAEDLAVQSLEIHNSTHITRVKDANLRRDYKKAYPFINFKRPNIREIIYSAAFETHSKDICVVTSGPKSMINECKKWSAEIGVDMHSEVFLF